MADGKIAKTRRGLRLVGLLVLVVAFGWFVRPLAQRADQGVRHGVIALELIGSTRGAAGLLGDGTLPITPTEAAPAVASLIWDLAYIGAYTLALITAAWLLVPLFRLRLLRSNPRRVMILAGVPGLLDLAEDGLLALALHGRGPVGALYSAAAALAYGKFVVLVVVLALLVGAFSSGLMTRDRFYARLDGPDTLIPETPPEPPKGRGIALSGGGVRAASLALGALQELERDDGPLGWGQVSAVSSVSGGSYMAGAWQLGRNGPQASPTSWALGGGADGALSPEEVHLLDNLGYLTSTWPRGRPGDPGVTRKVSPKTAADDVVAERMRRSASFQATVLTGFLVNITVLVAVVVLVVAPVGLFLRWLTGLEADCVGLGPVSRQAVCLAGLPRMWAPGVIWLSLGLVLAVLWVLVGKVRLQHIGGLLGVLKSSVQGALLIGGVLVLFLVVAPLLVGLVRGTPVASVVAWVGAAAGMLGSVVRIVSRFGTSLAPKLGGIAFVVLLVLSAAGIISAVWFDLSSCRSTPLHLGAYGIELGAGCGVDRLLIAAAIVLLVAWLVSPELWALTAFYRGKLRSAYALWRRGDDALAYVNDANAEADPPAGTWYRREPLLAECGTSPLTICAAAHATTKAVRTHYGIPAMSFTFDSERVRLFVPQDDLGHAGAYECTVAQLANVYPGGGRGFTTRRITTMFAVALSGAAVSPAMGRFRIGPTSLLLAFTNVRLGTWLPNPRYLTAEDDGGGGVARFPKVRLGYLLKEALSIHDPTDLFVYVSDGGHWENTGLVELLRGQMPAEAVLVDADAGRPASVLQLTQAIDLAKLECGVEVFIDVEPLRGFPQPAGGPVFAERSVTLGLMKKDFHWSVLWYTKPILTRHTPTPLLAHREVEPSFPETSTLDQFFDTSTYTAYRDLGRNNAAEVMDARAELTSFLERERSASACLRAAERDGDHWVQHAFVELLRSRPVGEQRQLYREVRAILTDPPVPEPRP